MRAGDIFRLLILAAIWGGSFIFMRILAPTFGPVLTADLRVLIAGIALVVYFHLIKFDPEWSKYWKKYLFIGGINSALPFFLFSFAALHIPASLSVILNSTSPLFGAIFSAIWLKDSLTIRKIIGLLIGITGVALVTRMGLVDAGPLVGLAIVGCIIAAACYGFIAIYIKKNSGGAKSLGVAGGSQLMAALLLIPAIPFAPAQGAITASMIVGIIAFALLCSAIAYILYFRLIENIGPTKALTVTFLMPAFGMIWGKIFLNEIITLTMIFGSTLIILGTFLVLSISAKK
jgi:drug/metabolite transporter (DMT)-like permease